MAPAALFDFSVDQTQVVASNRIQPCFLLTKQQNSSANLKNDPDSPPNILRSNIAFIPLTTFSVNYRTH